MRVRTGSLVLGLALAVPAAAAADAVGGAGAPIKRFSQVSAALYRGGQPDAAGYAYLRALGVRTVISLRDGDDERPLVEALGMRFVHIPITFRPLLRNDVPDAALARFLAVVDDPASGPVFVHCRRGADRTGTFVGLYRVARQGWPLDRAYDEARRIGMRWWYARIKGEMADLTRTKGSSGARAH
jgi:protein tyrosine/serine phosphatase